MALELHIFILFLYCGTCVRFQCVTAIVAVVVVGCRCDAWLVVLARTDHLETGSKLPSQSVLSRSSKENVVIGRSSRVRLNLSVRLAKLQFLFPIVQRNYILVNWISNFLLHFGPSEQ